MKVKMSFGPEYESKHEWINCSCQGGSNGIVLPKGGFDKVMNSNKPLEDLIKSAADEKSYTTAFFEAFPQNPNCFIRGEGSTIEEAEEKCWLKYQKIVSCNHEMERRDRTDGYGYCKHCSYSSMVFVPLTKCCKCHKPTAYSTDFRKKWYCKKHAKTKPKNPDKNKRSIFEDYDERRLPRKYKKLLKRCAKNKFESEGHFSKIKFRYYAGKSFICENKRLDLLFKRQERIFIIKWKNSNLEKTLKDIIKNPVKLNENDWF